MTPLDALHMAMMYMGAAADRRRPGEIVAHLPRDARAALAKLTSADVARLRFESWLVDGRSAIERYAPNVNLAALDAKLRRRTFS